MLKTAYFAATAVVALIPAASASAQAPATAEAAAVTANGRTTVYNAAYFTQYAPRTALDIAQHVPGFQLDLGATQANNGGGTVDVRGFAGTAGNVVINGARPSSKAETLQTTLSRIPAQRVVRVEVGPGDLFGSDYAGKSQVLNVILSEQGGFDGNVTAAAKRWYTGYVNADVSGSALIRRGASTINLSAATGRNKQFEEGFDQITVPQTGAVLEHRRKHNEYYNRDPFVAASWALERASDSAFRLNARWQPSRFDLFQSNRVTPAVGPVHDDNLIQHYRDPVIEVGGDVTRPLAGGAIKFVGLATRRKRDDFDSYLARKGLRDEDAPVVGGFEQTVRAHRNETIGRVSWTKADIAGFSFEAGAEGAYNTLDSNVDFFEIDDGERVPIPLPIADATVEEKRGEVYLSVGRTLSPKLRVDGGVNYEFSRLKVRGDALADRSLKFLKPNFSVDWKPGGGWHGQLSIRRTVAQLDFYDFISTAELSADRVNGGNENLEPQRTWEFRLIGEHPIFGDGLARIELGHNLISMLQDRILIDAGNGKKFDAPGNLGTGREYFGTLTLDAPLNQLWKGLRVKFEGTLRHTSVDDPITGDPRKFSGFFPNWQWNVDVRRDAGPFSYGFTVNDNQRFTFYRTDEFDTNYNGGPYGTAFVEYRPGPRTAITFDIDNLFDTNANRNRLLFRPNRETPTVITNEYRQRDRHLSFSLTLKQTI